jgi:hypothetical protein
MYFTFGVVTSFGEDSLEYLGLFAQVKILSPK